MKPLFTTSRTHVYVTPLTESQPRRRSRADETAAIARLITIIFGSEARYTHLPSGAPVLSGLDNPPSISATHGASLAAVAASSLPTVGIDIEMWRPQLLRVAPRFVTDADTLHAMSQPERLLKLWTAKEAVYKAAHTPGLSLTDIAVDPTGAVACGRHYTLTFHPLGNAMIALAEPSGHAQSL